MREPVLRRAPSDRAAAARSTAKRRSVQLLSLCSVFSILCFGAVSAQAQESDPQIRYAIESRRAVSSLLLDVARAGERLIVAGDRGHVLYSDDEAQSWNQAKVPTRQMLTAISFVDAQHGWAVGHDALILATTDGGQTWTRQYEEREREAPLLDVWFENTSHGIAVGAYGALLETTDGGQSWDDISDRIDNEDGFHLNAIGTAGGALFIVGEMGGIFRSDDQGQTFERVESPYEGSFFGVADTGQAGGVLVFGLRGNMFRSTDLGQSWEDVRIADGDNTFEAGLADGSLLRDGRIAVVGHSGAVLVSDDQGRSFALFSRPDRRSLAGVTSTSQGNLILVGQGGIRVATPTGADLAQRQ